ncbi:cytochrome c [Labilibacter sediminis]|nr:cytochrome c [Labilibacter sediminis]
MRRYYTTLILSVCAVFGLSAQSTWSVPQDQKEKLNTIEFTESMEKSGADVFAGKCKVCHGVPGQNNFNALLNPSPGDPAGDKFQKNTDGELFYKISEGRVTMPSFKTALSKDDIWNIIAYVRSFNPTYVQETSEKIETNIPEGTQLAMDISYNTDKDVVEVLLTGTLNDITNPVGGVNIKLMAQRYFGNLQIDEAKSTNKRGIATFSWNKELPGDSLGNIELMASFVDSDIYGPLSSEKKLVIGKPNNNPPLNKGRAMWNTVKKAPLWIIIGYTGAVLIVWIFIFYVLFSLKNIFALGKESISEDEKLI